MTHLKLMFLVRHAVAASRKDWSFWGADEDRPLTPKGAQDFYHVAQGLKGLFPESELETIFHSGYTRGIQTAFLLQRVFPKAQLLQLRCLQHDEPKAKSLETIRKRWEESKSSVAFVGHNPEIEEIVSLILGKKELWKMKKGSTAVFRKRSGVESESALELEGFYSAKRLKISGELLLSGEC